MSATPHSPLECYFTMRGVKQAEIARSVTTPESFSDPVAEHMATRHSAGLFDFSFMACIEIDGCDSAAYLNRVQTRNLSNLQVGRLAYSLLLRDDGTVISDVTVWRVSPGKFLIFTGCRNDIRHLTTLVDGLSVSITDRTLDHAVLAVQGKLAWTILSRCLDAEGANMPSDLPYYAFTSFVFRQSPCLLARIGYSGETGYELVIASQAAPALWNALLRAGTRDGMLECGFSATDSLRIEAGHILFLRELAARWTPFELGLGRFVDFHNTECTGVLALLCHRWRVPARVLTGLVIDDRRRRACLQGAPVLSGAVNGDGLLTSICWSPILKQHIGLGFISTADSHLGTLVRLESGDRAKVARLPFYDPARFLARRSR
jgi:aminomethyltransferase